MIPNGTPLPLTEMTELERSLHRQFTSLFYRSRPRADEKESRLHGWLTAVEDDYFVIIPGEVAYNNDQTLRWEKWGFDALLKIRVHKDRRML